MEDNAKNPDQGQESGQMPEMFPSPMPVQVLAHLDQDPTLRLESLRLAVMSPNPDPEAGAIVAKAEAFYNFVVGGGKKE